MSLPRKHIAEGIAAELTASLDVFDQVEKREAAEPCAFVGGEALPYRPIPMSARLVETVCPARRCCAPGCGDKIQGDDTYEITWSDGSVLHIENGCVEWFVNGHPDYGGGHGHVDGLPA